MSDLKHPLIEEAYQSAENCYAEASATVDFLDQALKALQEEMPEFCEALSRALIKADQLIDHCGAIVQEIRQMRLKYCAAHSTSGLSPELDLPEETLAGIQRRQSQRPDWSEKALILLSPVSAWQSPCAGWFRGRLRNRLQLFVAVPDFQQHDEALLAIPPGEFHSAVWLGLDAGWRQAARWEDVHSSESVGATLAV